MATGFWARVRRYYLAGLVVLAPTALTLRVALVEYGSPGTHMVGFVTSTAASEAGEKLRTRVCHVFVPSAVNPTTGFLLVVPEEKVRYLEMTPEQAMRMIVSAGSIVPAR